MLRNLWKGWKLPLPAEVRRPSLRLAPELLEGRDLPSFFPPVFYGGFPGVIPVAVGDFNNDLVPDLVAVSSASAEATVGVLLGNGDGKFQDPIYRGVDTSFFTLAVDDFNVDGFLDVAVGRRQVRENPPRLSVLLGNGDGSLQKALDHEADVGLSGLIASDVNQDGIPDLVTADGRSRSVSVRLGTGDGTFPVALTHATGVASSVTAADFNGDGFVDLATNESVLFGNGDGTFGKPWLHGGVGNLVKTFDANGDDIADLVIAASGRDRLTVLLGNGDGSFTEAWTGLSPSILLALDVGDFNADGIPDLVTGMGESGTVAVFLGNGDGSFYRAQTLRLSPGGVSSVAAGDFNGDGFDDLAVGGGTFSRVAVFLNDAVWNGPGGSPSASSFLDIPWMRSDPEGIRCESVGNGATPADAEESRLPEFTPAEPATGEETALVKGRPEAPVFSFDLPDGLALALLE